MVLCYTTMKSSNENMCSIVLCCLLSGVYRPFHKTNSFLRFYLCVPTPYFYGHALFSYCML